MKLFDIAHSRAGDKGDTSILSLFAYLPQHYPLLVRYVTAQRVHRHLGHIVRGEVQRYEMPHLHALQFICTKALGGGVTTSLGLDTHGKSLSSALLELDIEP